MSLPFLALFLVFLLPYLSLLIAKQSYFKINRWVMFPCLVLIACRVAGYQIESKLVEFQLLYVAVAICLCFFLQYLGKVDKVVYGLLFVLHLLCSFPSFIFTNDLTNYFEANFIVAESDTYFTTFEERSHSLDVDKYLCLYQKVFGTVIYTKIGEQRTFDFLMDARIEEQRDTIVIYTDANEVFKFER